MNKKWQLYTSEKEKINRIKEKYNVNELIATVLANRGIEEENIKTFLEPTRADFHDPYLMPDMSIAVERIIKAMENNEKLIRFGDYDVDGITSITVLKSFLEDRGLQVDWFIPNRLEEGYGLNKEAIKKIYDEGYRLMITVDCGISGVEEIDYANSIRNGNNYNRSS